MMVVMVVVVVYMIMKRGQYTHEVQRLQRRSKKRMQKLIQETSARGRHTANKAKLR
jgi:uncharacterized membrane protein